MAYQSESGQKGFTLIESIVAVAVFAIAMTSITGVFLAVQRLNAEALAVQTIQQNTRFITEDLTKIIRNGRIDYARYPGGAAPQPAGGDLFLIDQDGSQVHLFLQNQQLQINRTGVGQSFITAPDVEVITFRVYIYPPNDPFAGGPLLEQPTVTVSMELEANINARDRTRIPFQLTAATRQYPVVN